MTEIRIRPTCRDLCPLLQPQAQQDEVEGEKRIEPAVPLFHSPIPSLPTRKREQQRGGNPGLQNCTEKEVEGEWTLAAGCEQCQARSSRAGAKGTRRVFVLQSKVCFWQDPGATKAGNKFTVTSVALMWQTNLVLVICAITTCVLCRCLLSFNLHRTGPQLVESLPDVFALFVFCYFERRNFSCLGDQSHWLISKIVAWSIVIAVA